MSLNILFTQPLTNQAVVVTRVPTAQLGKFTVRLDRYDLKAGMKIDSTQAPGDSFISFQDVTSDGGLYLSCSGSTFSVLRLPNAKPVLDKWTIPSSSVNAPGGVQTTIIAAYLLDDRRFVTINGGAQVFVWSIADKKELGRYIPPPDVAKYPQGLANGGTTALSPDRKKLAVFNGTDGFFIVDLTTLRLVNQIHSPDDAKQPDANTSLAAIGSAFSSDGGQFAALFQWVKLSGKPLPAYLALGPAIETAHGPLREPDEAADGLPHENRLVGSGLLLDLLVGQHRPERSDCVGPVGGGAEDRRQERRPTLSHRRRRAVLVRWSPAPTAKPC